MSQSCPTVTDAFAKAVKRHREKKSLSRAALARLSGLHQTYVGLLERGERSPSLDTAEAVARALGVSLSCLITEAEKARKETRRKHGAG